MKTSYNKIEPKWRQSLMAKHRAQIEEHEKKFGKLGRPMTEKQKKALRAELAAASAQEIVDAMEGSQL